MISLTPAILLKIVPNIGGIERATTITNLINNICPKYKIDQNNILHEFLAQIAFESIGFTHKTESLYYSTAERIFSTFPTHFKNVQEAEEFVKDPQKLANRVYSNRMGNGDEGSNEGYTYRGGGYIQLSGKTIYEEYAAYIKRNVKDTTLLVRTNDQYALDSACWFFAVSKKLIQLAVEDNFLEITKKINGGINGLEGRKIFYERAKKYLV